MTPENRLDPNVYLAVGWTGLALMGFTHQNGQPLPGGVSVKFGTALVALGVLLTASAVVRYVRLLKRLDSGHGLERPSRLAAALGVALAAIGTMVAVYLQVTG